MQRGKNAWQSNYKEFQNLLVACMIGSMPIQCVTHKGSSEGERTKCISCKEDEVLRNGLQSKLLARVERVKDKLRVCFATLRKCGELQKIIHIAYAEVLKELYLDFKDQSLTAVPSNESPASTAVNHWLDPENMQQLKLKYAQVRKQPSVSV